MAENVREDAPFEDPRWSLILADVLAGKTPADAAERVDLSDRQVRRIVRTPEFVRELQARQRELDDATQQTLLEHRRNVLAVARMTLAKQVEWLNDAKTPAGIRAKVARDVQDHLARLFPAALDVAVVGAELAEGLEQPRSVQEIYGLPPDADEAEIIDFTRIRARREAVRSEFPRPELQVVPEPDPAPAQPGPVVSAVEVEARWNDLLAKHTLTPDEQRELEDLPAMLMAARLREVPDRSGQYSTSNGGR